MPAHVKQGDVELLHKAGRVQLPPKPAPAAPPPAPAPVMDMSPIVDLAKLLGQASRAMSAMSDQQIKQGMSLAAEVHNQTEAFKQAINAMADAAPSKDETWDAEVTERDQFTGRVRKVRISRVKT